MDLFPKGTVGTFPVNAGFHEQESGPIVVNETGWLGNLPVNAASLNSFPTGSLGAFPVNAMVSKQESEPYVPVRSFTPGGFSVSDEMPKADPRPEPELPAPVQADDLKEFERAFDHLETNLQTATAEHPQAADATGSSPETTDDEIDPDDLDWPLLSGDVEEIVQAMPIAEYSLHIELRELGLEIESYCEALGIAVEEICPVIDAVLPVLPDGTIIGNWPTFRQARLAEAETVSVLREVNFELDEHEVALRALTSVYRRGYEDPLLLGLIYRRWRGYEDSMIPLRQSRSTDRWFREEHGVNEREFYHKNLTRRLGKSIRELQRLASILDVLPEWLRLHREGKVSLAVLERYLTLSPANQDELMDDLRSGVPVEELVRDYGLKLDRKERRLQTSLAGTIRKLRESVDLLEVQLKKQQPELTSAGR